MQASKGAIFAHRLFSVSELGFGNPEPNVSRLIEEFLKIGDAIAARWLELPKAILLLQMAPDDPASGAVYLYDRQAQVFYMICFEGEDDHLSMEDFDGLLDEYGLLRYAEQPRLVQDLPSVPASVVQPAARRHAVPEIAYMLPIPSLVSFEEKAERPSEQVALQYPEVGDAFFRWSATECTSIAKMPIRAALPN